MGEFLPPDTHTYVCVSEGKKCSIFGKSGVPCFLVATVLRFILLSYYRRLFLPYISDLPNVIWTLALWQIDFFSSIIYFLGEWQIDYISGRMADRWYRSDICCKATRVGFWTWIWSTRHCELGQNVAFWFQCWKNSNGFVWHVS